MEQLVIFLIGIIIGTMIGFSLSYLLKKEIKKMEEECPHGYQDWDLCPDCRH